MLNSTYSGQLKKLSALWDEPGKQKIRTGSPRDFQLDQLARDLVQEWNEMAMGCADFASGWQAG